MRKRPNVVFVFSDQHRAQAAGISGDVNVQTPNMDHLAEESIQFTTAVSCIPVCSPNRATLLTGQYPLTHGLFINDIPIRGNPVSIGEAFKSAGYHTGYIGKWHIDGHGRESFIPRERRKGFDFWQVLECTHDYNSSMYYEDTDDLRVWEGYDAEMQTRSAQQFIRNHSHDEQPFFLILSWGPPHDPYHTAPQQFKDLYQSDKIVLRPNVPSDCQESARQDLAGYYAHISALDRYLGDLAGTLEQEGIEQNTIFVYTSDHGDMLYSHGRKNKQVPWDESILVPLLIRYPQAFGRAPRKIDVPINSPDIMPTLLGLCNIEIPHSVEGRDYSNLLLGSEEMDVEGVLIQLVHPFGQWTYAQGGKEYRGVRTSRYTFVRDLDGPWLMYDNIEDPYQLTNLIGLNEYMELQNGLSTLLDRLLDERNDEFLSGKDYAEQWGYTIHKQTGKVVEFKKGTP